ncbi:MAG: DUF4129 domain-containing protein [Planctomycetaceae bacterium]
MHSQRDRVRPSRTALWVASGICLVALSCVAPAVAGVDAVPPAGSGADVHHDLDDILRQPEFRRLRNLQERALSSPEETPDWLRRLLRRLKELFNGSSGSLSALGPLWQVLAYTLLAVLSCLIVWLVVRAINNYRHDHDDRLTRSLRPEEGEADIPPGDVPADDYVRRAHDLAQNGQYREAAAQLILGAMSRIERAGLIRYQRGLTHRDYWRALRGLPDLQQAFRAMVALFEPICFGRREARREHYDASLAAYNAGLNNLSGEPGP